MVTDRLCAIVQPPAGKRGMGRSASGRRGSAPVSSARMSLVVEGLVKRCGRVLALDGLAMEAPVGHVMGFLGSNGAGKTTTMRIALGVLRSDAGSVRWNGID